MYKQSESATFSIFLEGLVFSDNAIAKFTKLHATQSLKLPIDNFEDCGATNFVGFWFLATKWFVSSI